MARWPSVVFGTLALCASGVAGTRSLSAARQVPLRSPAVEAAQAVVRRTCAGCHNDRTRSGNVSLEAFEVGRLLGSVQPLLSVLDHLERMQRDKEIEIGRSDEKRTGEYRSVLNKILPGNKPELDGAGRGM